MVAKLNVRDQGVKNPKNKIERLKQYQKEPTTKCGRPRCDKCYLPVFKKQKSYTCNGNHRHLKCWPQLASLKVDGEDFKAAKRELECKELNIKQRIENMRPKQKTAEEYLATAFEMNGKKFLKSFQRTHNRVFENYEKLCSENGNLEEFRANPLVFILANDPLCCTAIAKRFIDAAEKSQ